MFSMIFARRRLLREILHRLRKHPNEWSAHGDFVRHSGMSLSVPQTGRYICLQRSEGGFTADTLLIPLWWRGRLRRSARRVAWHIAASRIL